MDEQLIERHRRWGAWSGIVYVALVFGGWAIVGRFLIPPLKPSADAETIARFFQENTTSIRIGMLILMLGALLAIPFSATISGIIGEVEKRRGFITYSAVLGGAGLMILTFYPAIFYLVAAFRPADRSPELIQLMNDLAWLQLIGGISVFLALPIAVAITAFVDKSANPVFPRWMGYFNAWVIALIIPDQLIFFFHSGPFAWNGLFGLWVPAGVFGLWFIVTTVVILRHKPSAVAKFDGASTPAGAESVDGSGRESIRT